MNVLNPDSELSRAYARVHDLSTALSRLLEGSDGSHGDVSAARTLCADIFHAERRVEAIRAREGHNARCNDPKTVLGLPDAPLGRHPSEPVNHVAGAAQALIAHYHETGRATDSIEDALDAAEALISGKVK